MLTGMLNSINSELIPAIGALGFTAALIGVFIWVAGNAMNMPNLNSWGKRALFGGLIAFGSSGVITFVRWAGTTFGGGVVTG